MANKPVSRHLYQRFITLFPQLLMAAALSRHHINFMNKPQASVAPPGGDADDFLIAARKSFQLASQAIGAEAIELYAKEGREHLRVAHEAAELKDTKPSFWRRAGS
jgi:putative heme iron utilization protein